MHRSASVPAAAAIRSHGRVGRWVYAREISRTDVYVREFVWMFASMFEYTYACIYMKY
jgi:hypothetical protein